MCGRQTNRGRGQNVAAWPTAIPSNHLSLCRHVHCHPADGVFDPRDTLVHAIKFSPNILVEVSNEVENREITSCDIERQWQETIAYIICLLSAQHHTLGDWVAATKFKTAKINSGGFA